MLWHLKQEAATDGDVYSVVAIIRVDVKNIFLIFKIKKRVFNVFYFIFLFKSSSCNNMQLKETCFFDV